MSVVSCNLVLSRTLVRNLQGKVAEMTAITVAKAPLSPRRRARLVRTLFVLSALSFVLAGLINTQTATATSEVPTASVAFNYVSVMPGDTLWELAQQYADGRNAQDWIAEVILLNNLSSPDLVAGDKLALP